MAVTSAALKASDDAYQLLLSSLSKREQLIVARWHTAWAGVEGELLDSIEELAKANVGGRITNTMLVKSQRLQAALDAMTGALTRVVDDTNNLVASSLAGELADTVTAHGRILQAQLPGWERKGVTAGYDIDIPFYRGDPSQIAAITKRTGDTIHKLTRPLSPNATRTLKAELLRGVAVGANPRVTARRVVDKMGKNFNGGLGRALNIARTETLDAHRTAAQKLEQDNADILGGWMWDAHLDDRTCRACIALHGQTFTTDQAGPEGHQQCRCGRLPVTKSWEELLGADAARKVVEPKPLEIDKEAWFGKLPEASQRRILGKDFDAWKSGDYPMSAWAQRQQNPGWRPSWVAARPGVVKPPPPPKPPPSKKPPPPAKLTPEEAVAKYTTSDSFALNSALRRGEGYDPDFVEALDAAFVPAPRAMHVRRVVSGQAKYDVVDAHKSGKGIVTNLGYSSTQKATYGEVLDQIEDFAPGVPGGRVVVMDFTVPKGFKIVDVKNPKGGLGFDQGEVLLPRGTRFQVTDLVPIPGGNGALMAKVRLLAPGDDGLEHLKPKVGKLPPPKPPVPAAQLPGKPVPTLRDEIDQLRAQLPKDRSKIGVTQRKATPALRKKYIENLEIDLNGNLESLTEAVAHNRAVLSVTQRLAVEVNRRGLRDSDVWPDDLLPMVNELRGLTGGGAFIRRPDLWIGQVRIGYLEDYVKDAERVLNRYITRVAEINSPDWHPPSSTVLPDLVKGQQLGPATQKALRVVDDAGKKVQDEVNRRLALQKLPASPSDRMPVGWSLNMYKRERAKITREVLAEVRDMGVKDRTKHLPGYEFLRPTISEGTAGTRASITTQIEDAFDHYPTAWLESNVAHVQKYAPDGKLLLGWEERGYNSGGYKIVLSPDWGGRVRRTVAVHEAGHSMENHIPGLTNLEWAFWHSRIDKHVPYPKTGKVDLVPSRDLGGAMAGEKYRPDKWGNDYEGKSYGELPTSHFEILTMGMQSLFKEATDLDRPGALGYDLEFERWVLGVLSVL